MYCPICFNDTLKAASSGVIKLTFDGKSKSTSQFYYNTKQETVEDIYKKLTGVVAEYFIWYATFNNKDPIRDIEAFSSDFICSTGCKLTINHRLNVYEILLDKKDVLNIVTQQAQKYNIPLNLSSKN